MSDQTNDDSQAGYVVGGASPAAAALAAVAHDEDVLVVLAAESGSRAWGFASPDSDWDVRFVYAVPARRQTRLYRDRDTIERSLPGNLDLAGWELRKALALLLKGNCALREWLASPIRYPGHDAYTSEIAAIARNLSMRRAAHGHYLSLIREVRGRHLSEDRERVNLKRYLYAIRPSLVLRWLGAGGVGLPPMAIGDLLEQVRLSEAESAAIARLLEAKRLSSEIGEGARLPALDTMIDAEAAAGQERMAGMPAEIPSPAIIRRCDDLLWEAARA